MTDRVDWNINEHNRIFWRYKMDRGFQPTETNLVNSYKANSPNTKGR